MKRVLTLTTAISVALAGMPPVPLWAQDQGAAQAQCPPDKPDCEPAKKPRKPRKPAAQQDEQTQGQEPQQQRQGKPAKPAKPAASEEAQQGDAVKPAKPAKPAKPVASEEAQQDQAVKPAKPARQGQKPAVTEPAAKPAPEPVPEQRPAKRQSAKPQAGAEQQIKPQRQPKPAVEPEAKPSPLPAQDEPVEPPVMEQQEQAPVRPPRQQQPKPQQQEAQKPEAQQPDAQPSPKPRKPAKPAAGAEQQPDQQRVQRPRQQQAEKPPAPDADTAINDVLAADQQARPAKRQGQQAAQPPEEVAPQRRPQAAIAAERGAEQPVQQQTQRQVKRQRIGEADLRRADEEFRNPLRPGQQQAQEQAEDDDDDGLSDLEKAGLVVLGALAVGALLKNGNRVVSNSGDRVVVDQGNGQYFVMKDDDTLLRQPGNEVETETFADGSIRTTVYRPDGSRVVTVRDAAGRVLQRVGIDRYGNQTLLIDDLNYQPRPVNFDRLPRPVPEDLRISTRDADAELRAAMLARQAARVGESFSLQQIRDYPQVRGLAPTIDVQNVTFDTGSAAIRSSEARNLSDLGEFMAQMIKDNPAEMFLIEGHTDAVGDAAYNLALSDRRAESLALALTEYFDVPPENMVVQGYGESELLVPASGAEAANRRTTVRMISPLMQQLAQAN